MGPVYYHRFVRRVLTAAFGTLVALAFVGAADGCTFLVSFDDVPVEDAGIDRRQSADRELPDTFTPEDVGTDAPIRPPTPPCDPAFPLSEVKGCETFINGAEVCADNSALVDYPGASTDLVACAKQQGATCVRHCIACAHLPEGFPDQCDQCIGRPDGTYCGTDMSWQPIHFKLLVTCAGERMDSARACANGCDSKGGTGSAECAP